MEPRYGLLKGLFMALCVVLMIGAVYRGCRSQAPPPAQPQNAGYEQRFCEDTPLTDHSASNPEEITIQLRDGCFGNHTKLPRAWNTWFEQKSRRAGDWAAVWCEGNALPGPPHPYTEDMGTSFDQCRDQREFFLEGKGTMTFRRTSVNPEYAAQANGAGSANRSTPPQDEREAGNEPAKQYKLTPIGPEGGTPADYTFTIEQCYRSGEKIECWGKAVNKTDALTTLGLHDSNAVDDEGNSIFVGLFGGGFMFPNANRPDGGMRLMPNVPTKFTVTIDDPHQNVKAINLSLRVQWGEGSADTLIYKDVPVQ